ncbi:hypothetical protein DPMN_015654 [Dreissena polymorpha]|uniref:Uncharacterized protein n=1 Tax=Dreissena polymorpha TaxID=45954 RepID=A0A9D4NBV3_DREPO|nr:hypothetical protein DPMN_015654 [Dreissena polymorpha]
MAQIGETHFLALLIAQIFINFLKKSHLNENPVTAGFPLPIRSTRSSPTKRLESDEKRSKDAKKWKLGD